LNALLPKLGIYPAGFGLDCKYGIPGVCPIDGDEPALAFASRAPQRQCSPDTAHGLFGDSERSRRMACNQLRCFLGAALQHGDIRHHLVEQTERQRPGGLDHRAVKIRSLVRAGPTREASRLIFDIDRELPSVRAIGKPIRVAALPIQMSQNRQRSPRYRQCRRRRWPRSSAPGSFPARSAPPSRVHLVARS
jgi:hypothetical protein